MQSQDNHREFEELLQWHADRHRMYPNERVWQQIQTELHGDPKWPALTICTITILVLLTLATALLQRKDDPQAIKAAALSTVQQPVSDKSIRELVQSQTDIAAITQTTLKQAHIVGTPAPAVTPSFRIADLVSSVARSAQEEISSNRSESAINKTVMAEVLVLPEVAITRTGGTTELIAAPSLLKQPLFPVDIELPPAVKSTPGFKIQQSSGKRFSLQYYLAGSSSFRRLTDEKLRTYNSGNYIVVPNSAYTNLDVNQVVIQTPGYGVELGANLGYALSSRMRIYAGAQFNYREYRIQGFGWNTERVSIALRGADTLNAMSNYRLSGGSFPVTLKTRGWELSMPLGLQYDVVRKGRFSAGIGGSLQPTLVIDKTPFAVSTDYKSYADGSTLLRHFNLNTSIEGYFRWETADRMGSWQLGPQVRYQQFSTLDKKYPIKEFLYDYGVKIGYTRKF